MNRSKLYFSFMVIACSASTIFSVEQKTLDSKSVSIVKIKETPDFIETTYSTGYTVTDYRDENVPCLVEHLKTGNTFHVHHNGDFEGITH